MKSRFIFVLAVPVFFILMFLFLLLGGGSSANDAAPLVATEETAEKYAAYASQLGAPWDIVMITDAIYAYQKGQSGVEDFNPIYTTLQFLILTEIIEKYEATGTYTDPETGETETTFAWVTTGVNTYVGREEILAYLGITLERQSNYLPEQIAAAAEQVAEDKSNSSYRYTVTFSVNGDFETVLREYEDLDEAIIEKIIDLYNANYIEVTNLSQEAIDRIRAIQAEYGIYQYADGDYVNCEGLVFTDGGREVVYYNQLDSRWADKLYGKTSTIGRAGCGPTSMAIVISTLTDQTVDPVYMSAWSESHGYMCEGNGSYRTLIPGAAAAFGLTVESCGKNDGQKIIDALADGKLVVAIMAKGYFTSSGHYLVLRGVTEDGKIMVADSASTTRSEQEWDLTIILGEASYAAGTTGPFWIIGGE